MFHPPKKSSPDNAQSTFPEPVSRPQTHLRTIPIVVCLIATQLARSSRAQAPRNVGPPLCLSTVATSTQPGRSSNPGPTSTRLSAARRVDDLTQQDIDEDAQEPQEGDRSHKDNPRDWHAALRFVDDDESEPEEEEDEEDTQEDTGELEEDEDSEDDLLDGELDDSNEVSSPELAQFLAFLKLKRKDRVNSKGGRLVQHFTKWGRHCHRLIGAYTDVAKVIICGLSILKARPKNPEDYDACYKAMPNMSAATAQFYMKKFFYMCGKIPKLTIVSSNLLSRAVYVFAFAKFMRVQASAGRSTDIGTLRRSLTSYLPTVVYASGHSILPLSRAQYNTLKTRNAGYYSPSTARLIIPIDERDDFDAADDLAAYCKRKATQHKNYMQGTSQQAKNSRAKRTSVVSFKDDESLPSFLYPTYQKYDPANPQAAIFKGDFFLDMIRHLWKGPSAVGRDLGEPGLGRACLANIYGVTKMTPDYIAYTASIIRFLLLTDARWSGDDKQRSGHRFHVTLHELLLGEYEAWEEDVESGQLACGVDKNVDNIISYFNKCLLGSEYGHPDEQNPIFWDVGYTDDGKDTLRVRILNARKAELEALRDDALKAKLNMSANPREASQSRSPSVTMFDGPPASSPPTSPPPSSPPSALP
ncbi:hypothetical protein DICSQDRAFT_128728 [Dichomitus squalens LYAD-421 SS1]|uniref:Uncharacterized protein n=1 Tax=Dichomitus squalens (strain LYAD-421) TaxID=732165 RepID=R7SS10_DICSQ|nr:uncharacterized protein DICSQDRAFT_128728 [Dichomitus squalens LYAD-421 SS1]EJF58718.1 hypothetical protein DICSQDRAFT_128728 [Dichomitus squalens LYAD-421 SS1]